MSTAVIPSEGQRRFVQQLELKTNDLVVSDLGNQNEENFLISNCRLGQWVIEYEPIVDGNFEELFIISMYSTDSLSTSMDEVWKKVYREVSGDTGLIVLCEKIDYRALTVNEVWFNHVCESLSHKNCTIFGGGICVQCDIGMDVSVMSVGNSVIGIKMESLSY